MLDVQRSASGALVTIGGKTRDASDKMEWHSDRENKSIIRPSAQELAVVKANLQRWINSTLNG